MNTFTSSAPSALRASSVGPGFMSSWDCASKIVSIDCVLVAGAAACVFDDPPPPQPVTSTSVPIASSAVTGLTAAERGNQVAMGAKIRLKS
jgi:hypothetical protein